MTVAWLESVMATVFRIRWFVTVRVLELALRIVFLIALFTRPAVRRGQPWQP